MKFSMMSYTVLRGRWQEEYTVRDVIYMTTELGLEGIDWVTTYGSSPEDIRKMMDDAGLKTICHTFFTDINFPTAKERQQGIDKIKEGIETAMILGTDKIMLPISGKPGLTAEQSRRNVVEGLKQAVEIGNKCGVTITVEHFPAKLAPFITSEDVNEAIREVPDLRITYDGGNILTGGEDPVEGYLNSKTYIIHSHFKDWLISNDKKGLEGKDGNFYIPALVGDGIVDYKRVLEAMNSSGYSGYINIEYEGYDYRPEDAMAKGLQYLKALMEG